MIKILKHDNPVLFFSDSDSHKDERVIAEKYFNVYDRRTKIPKGSLVIPRYSALPYNKALCDDIENLGSITINTYMQHCYVADLRNWYYDLGDITPRTWFALDQIPEFGPFVLKGQTNSKKFHWNTHMFANNKREAGEVFCKLSADGHVGYQQIYVRQFEQLHKLDEGLNGLPISEEYRFFVLDGKIIDAGFYWTSHSEDLEKIYDPFVEVPKDFVEKIIKIVSPKIRFWVFDVARKQNGDWILIELNDGQQSGLSDISADKFYQNLKQSLCR
jgi:hypothetical protein